MTVHYMAVNVVKLPYTLIIQYKMRYNHTYYSA